MIWISHILFASLLSLSIFGDNPLTIFVSSLSSLLPDVDTESKIRKSLPGKLFYYIFFLPAALRKKDLRHRGLTHSFLFLFFLSLLCLALQPLVGTAIVLSFLLGYFSHIVLDGFTKKGVQPLLPLSKKKFKGFVKVGGISELFFDISMVLYFTFLWVLNKEIFFLPTCLLLFFLLG